MKLQYILKINPERRVTMVVLQPCRVQRVVAIEMHNTFEKLDNIH
jgi:hypothetical protein